MEQTSSEEQLTSYLLGQLSEAEQTVIEERFLADGNFYEQMLAVEDELRCAYVRNLLPEKERELFEKRFMIFSDERSKAELAETMIDELKRASTVGSSIEQSQWRSFLSVFDLRRPALQVALGVVVLGVLFGVIWLRRPTRTNEQGADLQVQKNSSSNQVAQSGNESQSSLNQSPDRTNQQNTQPVRPASSVVTLALTAGRIRGAGQIAVINLTKELREVELKLRLKDNANYANYQVELLNSEGRRVLNRPSLRSSGQVVTLRIPVRYLKQDDYEVTLKGITSSNQIEIAGDYYFTVLKK